MEERDLGLQASPPLPNHPLPVASSASTAADPTSRDASTTHPQSQQVRNSSTLLSQLSSHIPSSHDPSLSPASMGHLRWILLFLTAGWRTDQTQMMVLEEQRIQRPGVKSNRTPPCTHLSAMRNRILIFLFYSRDLKQASQQRRMQIDTKITTSEPSLATAALTASVDLLKTPFHQLNASLPSTTKSIPTGPTPPPPPQNVVPSASSNLPSSLSNKSNALLSPSSKSSDSLQDPESPLPTNNSNLQQLERKRNTFVKSISPRDTGMEGEKKELAGVGFRRITNFKELKAGLKKPTPNRNGPLLCLTKNLVHTYSHCNAKFDYQTQHNPRRVLTKPSKPAHNDGYDNEDWDYILYVNDILGSQEGQQYQILDILGQGTFGQVVKCQNIKSKALVAVKVIKNKPAYYNQSLVEVAILDMLNNEYDKQEKHNIVCMKDTFLFRNHLCIIFEMLSVNLYELIKQNQFRGLSTNLVRVFVQQILECLIVLNKARIIHCDLKPENILLKNLESPTIKSRFYRSPEVLLGLPYTSSIDMWSLGCIAAELFLGLPLFPGSSEYNQVARIVEMLGVPHSYMCEKGKSAHQFFEKYGDGKGQWRLKTMEQYMKETGTVEQPSKRYFNGTTLQEIVNSYPVMRKGLSSKDVEKGIVYVLIHATNNRPLEMQNRQALVDFLSGLLQLNPLERWSPQQAKMHPFLTGEKFTGPFAPPQRASKSPAVATAPTSDESANVTVQPLSTGRRPRANTISSSKVQTVPPQLQRLVAIQQQSGPNKATVKSSGGVSKEKSSVGSDPSINSTVQKLQTVQEGVEQGRNVIRDDVSDAFNDMSLRVDSRLERLGVSVTPSSLYSETQGSYSKGMQGSSHYTSPATNAEGHPLHDLYYATPASTSPNMMRIPMGDTDVNAVSKAAIQHGHPFAISQHPPFPLRKARSQTISVHNKHAGGSPMGSEADLVMKSADTLLGQAGIDPSYSVPLGIIMDPSVANPNPPDTFPNENHPRMGEKGERKTGVVSRVPSLGLSAEWDPFENSETASMRSKGFSNSPSSTSSKVGSRRGSFTAAEPQTIDIGATLGNISRPPQYGASRRSSIPNAPIWPPRHIVAAHQSNQQPPGGSGGFARQVPDARISSDASGYDDHGSGILFSPRAPPTLDDSMVKIEGFRVKADKAYDTMQKPQRGKDQPVNFRDFNPSAGNDEVVWSTPNGQPFNSVAGSSSGFTDNLSTSPAMRVQQGAAPRAGGQLWKQIQHQQNIQPPSQLFNYQANPPIVSQYGGSDFRTAYTRHNTINEPSSPQHYTGPTNHFFQKRHSVPSLASAYEQHQHTPPQPQVYPQMYPQYGGYGSSGAIQNMGNGRRGSVNVADRNTLMQFTGSAAMTSPMYSPSSAGTHQFPFSPNDGQPTGMNNFGMGSRQTRTQPISIPSNVIHHPLHPHNISPGFHQGYQAHHAGSMPNLQSTSKPTNVEAHDHQNSQADPHTHEDYRNS
ncbi:dual specificity protein kinase yak1 [Phlyctochytrium planicorne]|nr:dual specificity protein kinase yak1 [Phlyctochytrium planicorne]